MGIKTKISWCEHTFNPWRGCAKVSPACLRCYAEAMARQNPKVLGTWGASGARVVAGAQYWQQPLVKWAKAARKSGTRSRVFCASMADVFEDRPDLVQPRAQLYDLVEATPELDWLLLTKRPMNVMRMLPQHWTHTAQHNVWYGATVETPDYYWRIHELQQVPAVVRFLSVEPMLAPMPNLPLQGIDWVIIGGETGHGARRMQPDWAKSVRDQCVRQGVAFFFKQWGSIDEQGKVQRKHDYPGYDVLEGAEWKQAPTARMVS